MGRLAGIARREKKRAPMETLERAEISRQTGVAEDSRGKPGQRQVTVISAAAWRDACRELGQAIPWTTRRANLLVEGIDLPETTGGIISIGPVRLLVSGEVDPCSRMDEQYAGLTRALQPDWRGGVACTVLEAGSVALGDSVTLELPQG
ncbi:MAG TPA: MOSC domain-containing protein [Woeseiaceae bacterium]|nr:MOSC domain-containing protein [Woeseiaceae bacterium]